jgi:hypothetical protein
VSASDAGTSTGADAATCTASSMVVNGAFEQGNSGFSSDNTYVASICAETEYTIATTPSTASCYGWPSFGDHTSGHGLMLINNAATMCGKAVWRQQVTVVPHTNYMFTFYAADVDPTGAASTSQLPLLEGVLNGALMGNPLTLTSTNGQWLEYAAEWTTGAETTEILSIVDLNLTASNNDFALDDVSVATCP